MTKQLLALVTLVFSLSAAQAQDWENFVAYPQTAEGASSITFVNAETTTQEGMIYALDTELVIYWFGSEGLETHCGAESLVLKPLEVRELPRNFRKSRSTIAASIATLILIQGVGWAQYVDRSDELPGMMSGGDVAKQVGLVVGILAGAGILSVEFLSLSRYLNLSH